MTTKTGLKYLWQLPDEHHDAPHKIAAALNLSIPVIQTLFTRGYTNRQACEHFLFTKKEEVVAHPSLLKDAQKAVDRLICAINNQEKILIAGDYDVDGITSSALLLECLLPLGAQVNFFLPHRVNDGYGLSVKTIERAAKSGYSVVITVDNGITAFEPAVMAQKFGIDLIITDHHRPHEQVPAAFAVIDPHQADCLYPYKLFAGVGIGFKVMSLLYEQLNKPMPDKVYELLLLGTVADVVPLTHENRFWVRHGLHHISLHQSYALQVLKENARFIKPMLSSTDIGFFITPQINALGRLDDPRDGVKFLIGSDHQETTRIGTVLAHLNEARKTLERSVLATIEADIAAGHINIDKENIILAVSDAWPPGVIGLVASRLVAAYGKPALLFHRTADGKVKGSCRSISAFNMFQALQANHDILITFGGHAAAAGLSLEAHRLPELKQRLETQIAAQLKPEDFKQKIKIDAGISLSEVTAKLVQDIAYLEPFGCENAQPVFWLKNVVIREAPILLKEAHVKCTIFADGIIKSLIFFNRPDIFTVLKERLNEPFDVAVQVLENHWNGRIMIELQGIDIAA